MTNDDATPGDGRSESANEKLDRNWMELLQELRVIQTSTQVLTGFLLTLPFQQRFADLDGFQTATYLTLIAVAAVTTVLALTPVSLHRLLFGQRAKREVVQSTDAILKYTLWMVGATVSGTVLLVFDVVLNRESAILAAAVAAIVAATTWLAVPIHAKRRRGAR
jgi:Family of unknown function (DUF6328)